MAFMKQSETLAGQHKRASTMAAKRDRRANSSCQCGGWTLFRLDDMNWGIKSPEGRVTYYSQLDNALGELLQKRLGREEWTGVADLKAKLLEIRGEIAQRVSISALR